MAMLCDKCGRKLVWRVRANGWVCKNWKCIRYHKYGGFVFPEPKMSVDYHMIVRSHFYCGMCKHFRERKPASEDPFNEEHVWCEKYRTVYEAINDGTINVEWKSEPSDRSSLGCKHFEAKSDFTKPYEELHKQMIGEKRKQK